MKRLVVVSLVAAAVLMCGALLRGDEAVWAADAGAVTCQEAYDLWKANPDKVNIIDVRTPEEYAFVGHAEGARNIPVMFMSYTLDAKSKKYGMLMNEDFVKDVEKCYAKDTPLLVMCRSGARSSKAIGILKEAGFTNLREIPDGFEGGKLKKEGDANNGKRVVNGWKVEGVPWTYSLNPDLVYGFVRE